MKISYEMQSVINRQINNEFHSAYIYMTMSAKANEMNMKGFANWFEVQAKEEFYHAEGFIKYLIDRGGIVAAPAIDAVDSSWTSLEEMYKASLEQEQKVTADIDAMVALAHAEKDFASVEFLNWYVREQVEEEASASEILEQIRFAKSAPCALMFLDKQLGKRKLEKPEIWEE